MASGHGFPSGYLRYQNAILACGLTLDFDRRWAAVMASISCQWHCKLPENLGDTVLYFVLGGFWGGRILFASAGPGTWVSTGVWIPGFWAARGQTLSRAETTLPLSSFFVHCIVLHSAADYLKRRPRSYHSPISLPARAVLGRDAREVNFGRSRATKGTNVAEIYVYRPY